MSSYHHIPKSSHPSIIIPSYHHIIISSYRHFIVSSYHHIIHSYHSIIPHRDDQYKTTFLLKTYRSYPLKVVIFRGCFFKAQHAMVSNELANLYFLGFVSSPHRDDPYPQKYENAFPLKTYRSYPLKVVISRGRFFKAPTYHGFERWRRDASFRIAMRRVAS